MLTIDDYCSLRYPMEFIPDCDDGGFIVSFPDLPGCLSVGETAEEAFMNGLDAKKAWIEAAIEDGLDIPKPASFNHYSGQFKLRIPKSLHRALAEGAKREGVSMNQYCVYLLSQGSALFQTV